ncbi:hypothetical protein JL721_11890 [Aureococcus anophagefferens]|nr:hypothetical protein JL721_11890 [Aureococcus anophagefferens]
MYSSGSEDEEELFGNGGRPAADEASEDSDGPQPSAYDQSYGSLGGDVLGEPDAPAQGSPRRRRRRAASGDDDRTPSRLFDFRRRGPLAAGCELARAATPGLAARGVSDYTVTLGVFFEPPPAGGWSLFQTALVHCEESRGGRRRARVSEARRSSTARRRRRFGTFGDWRSVEPGRWQRVVVSVRCGGGGGSGRSAGGVKKGEVRTYVQATPLALVRHERVAANERFSLRSDGLYLFSSRSEAMMPGGILLRTARVDLKAFDDSAVRRHRSATRSSAVAEDDAAKVDAMRGKLALAELFAKPRPAWDAPAIVAAFGDAHVEGTSLEASSLLAWSHAVLDVALRRCLRQQAPFLAGLPRLAAQAAADAAHVFSRSAPLMKGLVRLLRNPGGPQLCAWLRAIKKKLTDADVGESLLLPLLVEGRELLLVVERPSERTFTVVVVATAPTRALRHHAVDAADGRKVKFRSALVLANVPKKNALDDVFWAASTLEASLVEAERDARDGGEPAGDGDDAFDARAAAAGRRGAWRSPQRSETAYVRCLFDALHYLMLRRGCRSRDAKQVRLALKAQLADFVARDLRVVAPDANGAKVARLVATQLAYGAAKFAARPDAPAGFRDGGPRAARAIARHPLEWRDALAWRVEPCAPDAGNAATLRKCRRSALAVPGRRNLRGGPRGAADLRPALFARGQPAHAIKNDKLLILALVQHTLACAVRAADASSPAGPRGEAAQGQKEPEKAAPEAVPTDWAPGEAAEAAATAADCLWDGDCDYSGAGRGALTLRRLVEHFTAAVLSTQQDRALDLACLVVPGAACAIADAILRRARGAELTAAIEAHAPALAVCRSAVLDYFSSPDQRGLEKIMAFEDAFELRPGRPTVALLRNLCRELSLATPNPHLELCDALPCTSNVMKNFPEIAPYRDLNFFWKFFLNADRAAFANYVPSDDAPAAPERRGPGGGGGSEARATRGPGVASALEAGAAQLRAQLAAFGRLLDEYLRTLDAQTRAAPGDEALVDRNSRLACDLHAHQLLLRRDATDDASVPGLLGSFLFLTTRHTFNKFRRDDGKILVPEFELYELLQHTRRRLCAAAAAADQAGLDAIMAPELATATSVTGAFVDGDGDASTDAAWGRVAGARNRGRYDDDGGGGPVRSVADSSELDVEIDAQIGQLTLRGKHLAALESAVAGYRDVRVVFGDAAIQASLSERAEHRNVYRLVGLDHSIEWWPTPHGDCPSIPDTYGREYDPSELFESELWIPRVFEPLRRAFFDGPGPRRCTAALRRRVAARREWHWSLHLATDARFCLAALQPSSGRRMAPFPPWWTHGGGAAYPVGVLDHVPSELDGDGRHESVVIRRDAAHADNLSGGVETYTPPRLLRGLIPRRCSTTSASGATSRTWLSPRSSAATLDDGGDDDDDDAGSKEASDDLILVELVDHGGCTALTCTGLVGRSARVSRVSKAAAKRRRAAVDALAALVADVGVLRVAAQSAEPRKRRDKAPPKKPGKVEELAFREGADVEWRSAAAAADEADKWLPCEVVRVDYGKRTYDLEFSGPYQYLGTQRGVKPEDVNARGANSEAKAEGEGQWRFAGLSDSEDDDWASDGHESDDAGDDRAPAGAGRSLPFDVRARLGAVFDAAGRDGGACAGAVKALAAAGRTFDTVAALVDAVAAHCGGRRRRTTASCASWTCCTRRGSRGCSLWRARSRASSA